MAYINHIYQCCFRDSRHYGGWHLWLVFRLLPGTLMGALLMILLSSLSARASSGSVGEPAPGETQSGHLLLHDDVTDSYRPALVHASKVHFDISGMIATVQVEQTFRNDTDRYLEGVYAFPLPDNAAVRHLEMVIGERVIIGKIREKSAARKIYEQAKKQGKKASLVEQQRPNMFTNRVANIGPGDQVTVRLEYVQAVSFFTDTFSLRFPMTITPRYMPGAPAQTPGHAEEERPLVLNPYQGWAVPTDQVPDADAISPRLQAGPAGSSLPLNPIEITAELDMGMPLANVESPYHNIALSRSAGVYSIRLAHGVSEMDRDFVLQWQPVTGSTPRAALFTEKVDDEYYALLMMVPPAERHATTQMPREIIFVVDTSGSMSGVSIEQARASVSSALGQLQTQDYFNIIEFNSDYRALYRNPMPASRHHVQQAQEFVRLLDASGGTEMLPALRAALATTREVDMHGPHAELRQVIFITDGAVGNEAALFEEVSRQLGDSRLFTVGIGSAPNSWFMRKAAQFGRGTHTHIGDLGEVGQKMGDLFEQLSHPAAVNLQIDWPSQVEAWPNRLPDLYQGQPLSLAVSFGSAMPQGELVVRGQINGRDWQQRLQLVDGTDPEYRKGHPGVASLWARRKIAGLLDTKMAGADENSIREKVLPLALSHQLLSPYTSFIAVEEVISRPPAEALDSKAVANAQPRGQVGQTFAYPQTATTGPAKAWFGVLLLFIALIVRMVRQPEVDHVPTTKG